MTVKKVIYRHYRDGDLSGINKVFHAAFCDYTFGPFRICQLKSPQYMKWKYLDRQGFKPEAIQIAEYRGKIVGLVVVLYTQLHFEGKTYKIGAINDLSSCPVFQRRGIAKTLMQNAFDYIQSEGWDASSLMADPNGYARLLFQRLGYKDVISVQNWFKFIDFNNLVHYIPIFLFLFPIFYSLKIYNSRKRKKLFFPDISIRYMKSSDLNDYLSLLNRSGSALIGFSPYSTKHFEWWHLQRPKGAHTHNLVAIKDNLIIGGISILESVMYAGFRKLKYCIISELFVDPSERNKGVGSLLLSEGERIASRNGCGILSTFTHEQDIAYRRFMKKNGYFRLGKLVLMLKSIAKDFYYPTQAKKAWYVDLEQVGF